MSALTQAPTDRRSRWGLGALIVLAIVAVQATWLHVDGRIAMGDCGTIRLWSGSLPSENSQQIADWYSLSHIIHGFLFYWLFSLIAPKAPVGLRLAMAVGVEAAWELVENSSFIIERYRANTSSGTTSATASSIRFPTRSAPLWASCWRRSFPSKSPSRWRCSSRFWR